MPKRKCCESRKNLLDGAWLNPKLLLMDNQQLSPNRKKFNDYPS